MDRRLGGALAVPDNSAIRTKPFVAIMVAALGGVLMLAGPASASFTGRTGQSFIDNNGNHRIYVVQNASVIYSLPWAYSCQGGFCSMRSVSEANRAVTDVVSTTGRGSSQPAGSITADRYTLSGTPTGVQASISGSYQRTEWQVCNPLTISRAVPTLAPR